MITTIEVKEDLCNFPMQKRSMKLSNFWENATVHKIDERCSIRWYFEHTQKSECWDQNAQKYSQNSNSFVAGTYHDHIDMEFFSNHFEV